MYQHFFSFHCIFLSITTMWVVDKRSGVNNQSDEGQHFPADLRNELIYQTHSVPISEKYCLSSSSRRSPIFVPGRKPGVRWIGVHDTTEARASRSSLFFSNSTYVRTGFSSNLQWIRRQFLWTKKCWCGDVFLEVRVICATDN